MPRLSNPTYYHHHEQLRRFWLSNHRFYLDLSSVDQWYLHDYFRPSHDLAKADLIRHRDEITKRRPALPAQAGRAFSKLQTAAAARAVQQVRAKATAPVSAEPRRRRSHAVTVASVVCPEIDAHKLARVFLEAAREELAQRAANNRDVQPAPPGRTPRGY